MSTKHTPSFTPGPWTAMLKPPASRTDHGWRAMAMCGSHWMVAAPYSVAFQQWDNEANARLMAMAPTMLEALVEAAGALQGAAECMRRVDAPKTADKLEEIALAAMLVITRATGEQR